MIASFTGLLGSLAELKGRASWRTNSRAISTSWRNLACPRSTGSSPRCTRSRDFRTRCRSGWMTFPGPPGPGEAPRLRGPRHRRRPGGEPDAHPRAGRDSEPVPRGGGPVLTPRRHREHRRRGDLRAADGSEPAAGQGAAPALAADAGDRGRVRVENHGPDAGQVPVPRRSRHATRIRIREGRHHPDDSGQSDHLAGRATSSTSTFGATRCRRRSCPPGRAVRCRRKIAPGSIC